jgi:hypothetical protein
VHLLQRYQSEIIKRFNKINPLSFLKIYHCDDDDSEYFDDEENDFNVSIIPSTVFY